jgi:hypothetical protein
VSISARVEALSRGRRTSLLTRLQRRPQLSSDITSGGSSGIFGGRMLASGKLLPFPGGRFTPRNEDERARFAAYALFRRGATSPSRPRLQR